MPAKRTSWQRSAPAVPTSAKSDTPLFPFLAKLVRGEDMTAREASEFFKVLTGGGLGSNQMAAALTALTAKGETDEELAGMASVMRTLAEKIRSPKGAVDISGTGSSAAKTFNVSTAAALVAAGAGITVAKQSNRGVTSKCGSADVLSELGVKVASEPAIAQSALSGVGLTFMFAPKFFPALRRVADIRSSLGIRTCLSLLGLMANPAGATRQVIGVWHRSMVEPVANALALLKAEHAWVVHGQDGMDEITLAGKTLVGVVKKGSATTHVISPTDMGLKLGKIEHLRTADAKQSASIIHDVLSSKRRDEARSLVVLNAAAAIYVGGLAKDPVHAARLAEQSIDSGMAQNKLERLIQITNKK